MKMSMQLKLDIRKGMKVVKLHILHMSNMNMFYALTQNQTNKKAMTAL